MTTAIKGGTAQERRRTRRAQERRTATITASLAESISALDLDALEALAAEARGLATEELGGKPNKGTKPDRRLRENAPAEKPEETALDRLEEAFHVAPDGDTAKDGDGDDIPTHAADVSREIAEVFVKVRPDASGFRAELEQVVDDVLRVRLGNLTLVADSAISPPPDGGPAPRGPIAWQAVFVPEGTLTSDGRAFAPGALTWRDLPLTLMAMTETSEGGHVGAEVAGRIDRIWRNGNDVMAGGVFDEGDYGQEIARMVGDGVLRGLSVDIAIQEATRAHKSEFFDEAGNWITDRPEASEGPSLDEILWGDQNDIIFVVLKGELGMATVCPFPAFADANISLAADGMCSFTHQGAFVVTRLEPLAETLADDGTLADGMPDVDLEPAETLTASAAGLAPVNPPREWFDKPELDRLTPMTIDDDGRVYGHAWGWGACHTGIPDVCTTAPRSQTQYAYFHVGELVCTDGERVAVGRITFGAGHADRRLSRAAAAAHYDDSATVGCYVRIYEDEFGGAIAGTLAADVSAEDAQKIRGGAPSGDWRAVNGNLELIALLTVNVPGFPVPRPSAELTASADAGLEVVSLTAAGLYEVLREQIPQEKIDELEALAAEAR